MDSVAFYAELPSTQYSCPKTHYSALCWKAGILETLS